MMVSLHFRLMEMSLFNENDDIVGAKGLLLHNEAISARRFPIR
jgi:hypothetical protein